MDEDASSLDETAKANAEKAFVLNLLKAVPEIQPYLDTGNFDLKKWQSYHGMCFMYELLQTCDRLVDQGEGSKILPPVFAYLEDQALKLELDAAGIKKLPPADRQATWFLLFTFTDNPTGKDLTLRKLSPFMGPKINTMCTQL